MILGDLGMNGQSNLKHETPSKNQFLRLLTILYLVLPSFLFSVGWLEWPFAIISILILTSFTVNIFSDAYRALPSWQMQILFKIKKKQVLTSDSKLGIALVFLLIIIWMVFSGAGGVGLQNIDYRSSNALLKDLIVQDWPLVAISGNTLVPIVYYVAYYLPAAVIGKAFGWVYANNFLFVWTLIGVVLAFSWFWNLSRIDLKNNRVSKLGVLTVIFCLSGGLDYIGYYVLKGNVFDLSAHVEQWADYFQYSSNTTLIYWVPQHTIAPWLIIGMIADALGDKHNLKYLGMAVATGIIWSPFGLVGTVPYLLLILFVYLLPQHRKYLLKKETMVFNALSIWIGAIYLLYLGSNQFKFPTGFIWQLSEGEVFWVGRLLTFECLEFALLGCLTLLLIVLGVLFSHSTALKVRWRERTVLLEQEFGITPIQLYLFTASLIMLAVLPLFMMGILNDLVMRGSIPSLFIFWAFIAKVVTDASLRVRKKHTLLYALVLMTLLIGFFPSIAEIARSAKYYHFGPPAFLDVSTTVDAIETRLTFQRLGNEHSMFYRYLGKSSWAASLLLPKSLPPLASPVHASLDHRIELMGYYVPADRIARNKPLVITLYWRITAPIDEDYTVFVHLIGENDTKVAQRDGHPRWFPYPTSRWPTGILIPTELELPLKEGAPRGEARILVGMYLWPSLRRLPAVADEPVRVEGDAIVVPKAILVD
jgi:hypothetical protein